MTGRLIFSCLDGCKHLDINPDGYTCKECDREITKVYPVPEWCHYKAYDSNERIGGG